MGDDSDDLEAPAEDEGLESEEIPAEGDNSGERCPSENDEDTMPESWNQNEEEEIEPDDDTVETGESFETEESYE